MPITREAVEAHILSCLRSAGAKAPLGLRKREEKARVESALDDLRQSYGIAPLQRDQHTCWVPALATIGQGHRCAFIQLHGEV